MITIGNWEYLMKNLKLLLTNVDVGLGLDDGCHDKKVAEASQADHDQIDRDQQSSTELPINQLEL